jgi:hypothetical protein
MKRRFGDRKDGYKLRQADPFFRVIPHIMPKRSDAQVFFSERVYMENIQETIRTLRKEGYKVGFLHIVLATMVRVFSQKPKINRFVVGKRTYARSHIAISLAIKKDMSEDAEETTIKVIFDPSDTIYDVCDKLNDAIDVNKQKTEQNNTDKMAKFFHVLPHFVVSGMVGLLKWMDRHNIMPKFIVDLSPFHTSMFVTDLGSLGIKPIYHHIYDFGTTSLFVAFGVRSKEQHIDDDLNVNHKKAMDIKIVCDERIVDGYYFASAIKYAMKIMSNPDVLKEAPEQIEVDNEI